MDNSVYLGGGGAYGGAMYHCVLVGNSAGYAGGGGVYDGTLYDCVLKDNYGAWGGGGARWCTLYNCALMGNNTAGGFYSGGGAYGCTLYNCVLTDNSSGHRGSGASVGALYNCTLTSDSVSDSSLYNCIVYYNVGHIDCTFNSCCTTPDPGGTGNITNEPMFVDLAAGNLRLLSNSPCINMGTNQDWMIGVTDLDGNPRIYGGGRVDMGAYEYQGSLSVIPLSWLAYYGLPIDGSEDYGDRDGDGMSNWREWRSNTNPTNKASLLDFTAFAVEGTGFVVRWQSAEGVRYRLERSTNLITDTFGYLVRTNIVATPSINSETDTTAVGSGPWFYRVGVE